MISYRLLIVFLCLFISRHGFSQQTGIVLDSLTKKPVPGAVVLSPFDTTLTRPDGVFRIADSARFIQIRHLGYKPVSLSLSPDTPSDTLYLSPITREIEAVIVSAPFIQNELLTTPSSVARLESDDLLLNSSFSYVEQLEQIPGITAQSGTFNTVRITIRGIGSRTPYATNRIKACLNDIPLTTGEGYSQIEDLDPAFIESVYIAKGAKSALYGSGLGGIVMIDTKKHDPGDLRLSAGVETGPYHTYKPYLLIGTGRKNISTNFGYAFSHTLGWRENSNYSRHNLYTDFRLVRGKTITSILLYYIHTHARIPSSINEEMFKSTPVNAAPNWLDVKGFEKYSRLLSGISHSYRPNNKWHLSAALTLNLLEGYESRPFNILDDNSLHITQKSLVSYDQKNFVIRGGIEWQLEFYNWQIYETISGDQGQQLSDFRETRYPLGLFLQSELIVLNKIILEGGIRYNLLGYRIEDHFEDTIDASGRYNFDPVLSPFLGLNLPLSPKIRLFASMGHGISYPDVEETLLPDYQINTKLKPETGFNLEAGIRGRILNNACFFDLSVYRMYVKNLLVIKRESEDIFYGENAGKSIHQGIELAMDFTILKPVKNNIPKADVNLAVNLSENKFTDFIDDGNDYSGNHLPGLPAASLYGGIKFEFPKGFYGTVNSKWTQKQYLNDANTAIYGDYTLINLKLGYKSKVIRNSYTHFYFGINNVSNAHYASMVLVNAPSFGGSAPRYYYPGYPRYWYLGVVLDLIQ